MRYFALFLLLLVTSCCPCRKGSSGVNRELGGTSWQLLQLNGHSVAAQEGEYTLLLGDDKSVGGVAKCNKIMGSYTYSTDKRTLVFEHMGMTRMMCHGESVEDEYGAMLGEVTHYEVDGQTLVMLSHGKSVALFKKLLLE